MNKLLLNLGPAALKVLGLRQYGHLLFTVLRCFPGILSSRNLSAVDRRMSLKLRISLAGCNFIVDCAHADQIIRDGSYTFGGVRELYIRNCYLRHHRIDLKDIKTVVDLGGNRGLFSLLAASFAKKVVYVEALNKYNPALIHNMRINDFDNFAIENELIGGGGMFGRLKETPRTFDDLLSDHSLTAVDFLKVDIEGSEFSMFREIGWLEKVGYLSMEVHREYGDPGEILRTLREQDFRVVSCDNQLEPTEDPRRVDFVYASNPRWGPGLSRQ